MSSPNPVRLGQQMARDSWTVLAIDMLHYGERASGLFTRFTTEDFAERLYNAPATYLEFVTQTVKDVRRSVDYLVQVRGVDAKRVVLVGFSRGAVLATIAGAVETRLAGVILSHGGHVIRQERGHQAAACPANYIQRISPRPLLTINTEQDALFPADASIRPLLRLARQPAQVRWTNGPHGYLGPEDQATILEAWRPVEAAPAGQAGPGCPPPRRRLGNQLIHRPRSAGGAHRGGRRSVRRHSGVSS